MEQAYIETKPCSDGVAHRYGAQVHLAASPSLLTLLARFGSPEVHQPEASRLLSVMYEQLLTRAIDLWAPKRVHTVPTRMAAHHPGAGYHGTVVDASVPVVVVDVLRAGIQPAQLCFDRLHDFFPAARLRQDHIGASRKVDAAGRVVGVELFTGKIGGPTKGVILLLPDPMGATGTTASQVLKLYNEKFGEPADVWMLHLIVTPEYIARVTREFPKTKIIAIRCDRGLSDAKVLTNPLGAEDKERGLNEHQYIVPGAGGIGEILNNSFV